MKKLSSLNFEWQSTGPLSVKRFITARRELHNAAQFIAATGRHLAVPAADDSHTSMQWNESKKSFQGSVIKGETNFHVYLRPADLTLKVAADDHSRFVDLVLHGLGVDDSVARLKEAIKSFGGDSDKFSMELHYEIPDPFSAEDTFDASDSEALAQHAALFANANSILQQIKTNYPQASAVRCWPHHFDIATLLTFDQDMDAEKARSVGIGMTPGDAAYPEPYFYLSPWPYPKVENKRLPDLPSGGAWNTEHWVGAVLTTGNISKISSAEEQGHAVEKFIVHAFNEILTLLDV